MKIFTVIILVITSLVLAIGLSWFGSKDVAVVPTGQQLQAGSLLVAEDNGFNFGTISMADGEVATTFKIFNPTENDVNIDSMITSCMCTVAYFIKEDSKKGPYGMPGHGVVVPRANEIIKPGEEKIIEVVFDPAAHGPEGVGVVARQVYIVDESGGALSLEIMANVII